MISLVLNFLVSISGLHVLGFERLLTALMS